MIISTEQEFKPRELVWAKIQGYPWWPGIINNIDEEADENSKFMVNFFGDTTYSYLDISKIAKFQDKFIDYSIGEGDRKLKSAIQLAVGYLEQRGILINQLNANIRQSEKTDKRSLDTRNNTAKIKTQRPLQKSEPITSSQYFTPMIQTIKQRSKKRRQELKQQYDQETNPSKQRISVPITKHIKKAKKLIQINLDQQQVKQLSVDPFPNQTLPSISHGIPSFGQQCSSRQDLHQQSTQIQRKQKTHCELSRSKRKQILSNLQKYEDDFFKINNYLNTLDLTNIHIQQLISQYKTIINNQNCKGQQTQPQLKNQEISIKDQIINKYSSYLQNKSYALDSQKARLNAEAFEFLISAGCGETSKYQHKTDLWGQILFRAQFSIDKLHELIKHFVQ